MSIIPNDAWAWMYNLGLRKTRKRAHTDTEEKHNMKCIEKMMIYHHANRPGGVERHEEFIEERVICSDKRRE